MDRDRERSHEPDGEPTGSAMAIGAVSRTASRRGSRRGAAVLSEPLPTVSAVASPRTVHRCSECGWSTTRWAGRCGECQAWGTLVATTSAGRPGGSLPAGSAGAGGVGVRAGAVTVARPVTADAVPIGEVGAADARAGATGIGELDRVLGTGLVPGAVVLMAGEPGVGKSTLLLDVAARWARTHAPVLYVSGEESTAQVRMRADRIGAIDDRLFLAAETELGAVLTHVDQVLGAAAGQLGSQPLLVVDSVQTVSSSDVEGGLGGVTQVREVAATLIGLAKSRGMTVVLVGHVTKDGSVAGPRTLEHLVDVVLEVTGERSGSLRLVRALKNRFGPTEEIGCFALSEDGITGLPDPSGLFLSRHSGPVPGTCVTVALEGTRPLVAEVQALVVASTAPMPRRTTSGLESSRTAMVLAVLERRAGVELHTQEVYAATVGGVRLTEPAVDLAVALAVATAAQDRPLPPDLVAFGEIGLAGELRPVSGARRRLAEAARLGFRGAIVPRGCVASSDIPDGLVVVEAADLASALLSGDRAATALQRRGGLTGLAGSSQQRTTTAGESAMSRSGDAMSRSGDELAAVRVRHRDRRPPPT